MQISETRSKSLPWAPSKDFFSSNFGFYIKTWPLTEKFLRQTLCLEFAYLNGFLFYSIRLETQKKTWTYKIYFFFLKSNAPLKRRCWQNFSNFFKLIPAGTSFIYIQKWWKRMYLYRNKFPEERSDARIINTYDGSVCFKHPEMYIKSYIISWEAAILSKIKIEPIIGNSWQWTIRRWWKINFFCRGR